MPLLQVLKHILSPLSLCPSSVWWEARGLCAAPSAAGSALSTHEPLQSHKTHEVGPLILPSSPMRKFEIWVIFPEPCN